MPLPVSELVEQAREELSRLTGLELGSTLGAVKDERGWRVWVELIEKKSLPDSMDILAKYETLMDDDGNLVEFTR
ncbi:MAG: gas vesicle protein GvpO, partial [Candidatus Binatia bacterium]